MPSKDSLLYYFQEAQMNVDLRKQVDEELDIYIKENYREGRWNNCTDDDIACIEAHQAHVRKLRFYLRWIDEYKEVLINGPRAKQYWPLHSRRLNFFRTNSLLEDIALLDIGGKKHGVGNWNCKGCLGTEVAGEPTKLLEWCPKFLAPLRNLSYEEYANTVPVKCYGGLLHSDIAIKELSDSKSEITLTKVCDTCGHTITSVTESKS